MLKDSNRNPSVEKHDVLYQIAALESSSQLGLFACGSYELNERDGLRSGKIALCDVKGRLQAESPLGPGVLDLKWRCRDNALLAATSDGFLSVYKACARETESALRITGAIGFPEEGLFLSLSVGDSTAVVSTQEGSILSVAVADEGLRLLNQNSAAHHMLGGNVPAWIVAMNPHANNIICSGGDDMTIKLWDLRCFETPTSCISKVHSAGVTCATFSPHEEHLVAVGSYDESVNFWDVRNMIKPLSSVKTGGGVWRIKFHPSCASVMLCACMHNGTSIIQYSLNGLGSPTINNDDEARSDVLFNHPLLKREKMLAYGADWCPGVVNATDFSFVASSFYERYFEIISY